MESVVNVSWISVLYSLCLSLFLSLLIFVRLLGEELGKEEVWVEEEEMEQSSQSSSAATLAAVEERGISARGPVEAEEVLMGEHRRVELRCWRGEERKRWEEEHSRVGEGDRQAV